MYEITKPACKIPPKVIYYSYKQEREVNKMTNYTTNFYPRNVSYTRKNVKMYTYKITIDGVTKRVERTKMIDYKKTIAYYKSLGKTIKFEYLGSYWWEE